jgi:hypothetical protein
MDKISSQFPPDNEFVKECRNVRRMPGSHTLRLECQVHGGNLTEMQVHAQVRDILRLRLVAVVCILRQLRPQEGPKTRLSV